MLPATAAVVRSAPIPGSPNAYHAGMFQHCQGPQTLAHTFDCRLVVGRQALSFPPLSETEADEFGRTLGRLHLDGELHPVSSVGRSYWQVETYALQALRKLRKQLSLAQPVDPTLLLAVKRLGEGDIVLEKFMDASEGLITKAEDAPTILNADDFINYYIGPFSCFGLHGHTRGQTLPLANHTWQLQLSKGRYLVLGVVRICTAAGSDLVLQVEAPNGHKYAPFLAAHLGHLDAYFMDWEGEQKVLLEDGTKLYHGINFPGKYVPVGGSFFSLMVRLEVDASGEGGQPSDAMRIVARSWDRYQQNALAEFAAYRNAQQMERD